MNNKKNLITSQPCQNKVVCGYTSRDRAGLGNQILQVPLVLGVVLGLQSWARADLLMSVLDAGGGQTRIVLDGSAEFISGSHYTNGIWAHNGLFSAAPLNTNGGGFTFVSGQASFTLNSAGNGTAFDFYYSLPSDSGWSIRGIGSSPTVGDVFGWSGDFIIDAPITHWNAGLYESSTIGADGSDSYTIDGLYRLSVGTLISIVGPSPAELELSSSAIPMNLAVSQIAGNVHNQGVRGINNRLFRARGKTVADSKVQRFPVSFNHSSTFPTQEGSASAKGADVVASGDNWEYFVSGSFGDVGLDNLGANPGLDAYTYSSTVGFEYKVNEQWALGLGWSHVWNDNTMNGGLGSVDIEGDAATIYATYSKNNCWADMLYSYGSYDADIRRNNGGGTSVASPEIEAHQLSLNMGYNIEAEISSGCFAPLTAGSNRLVYGPTLGIDYSIGALDGYAETGSPGFDAVFSEQDYDSLITRVGGQATHSTSINWGQFKSQLRLEYARENLNQGNAVSGSLVSNPVVTATQSDISPGTDWLEAGAGISLDVANSDVTVYLDYTGQFFREDVTAHYATIGAQIKF